MSTTVRKALEDLLPLAEWALQEQSPTYADEALVDAAKAALAADDAARGTMPCGHPPSLLLHSAETGEPLYCELCDDKSGRADAERRESELAEANAALRQELAGLKASQAAAPSRDAYEGCREDLLDWKRRALEAEETCRQLNKALAEEVNGPTFMGEPVLVAAPQAVPNSRPLSEVIAEYEAKPEMAAALAEARANLKAAAPQSGEPVWYRWRYNGEWHSGPTPLLLEDQTHVEALYLAPPAAPTDAEWQEEAMRLAREWADNSFKKGAGYSYSLDSGAALRAHIATRPLPAPPTKKEQQ